MNQEPMPVESTVRSIALNKHQQKTEQMRRKLLKSARNIFAKDGFEAARIEDIASDAGHTRGAFYAHFSSKEDLFFALLEHQAALHMERVNELLGGEATREERLQRLREYYVDRVIDRNWSLLVLEFKLFAIRHPRMRAKFAEAHRRMKMAVKVSAIEGLIPDNRGCDSESVPPVIVALQAALEGMVLEQAFDPQAISQEQAAIILRRIFDTLVAEPVQ